jgi:hypothetical protein
MGWKGDGSIEAVEGDAQFIELSSCSVAFGADVCEFFFNPLDLGSERATRVAAFRPLSMT